MTAQDRFPQEWPDYLANEAKVAPPAAVPPHGQVLLDFTCMSSETFEQFCWWLLKKDHTLAGCKRLGASGLRQGGIDLLAFDGGDPTQLRVFECKAWKRFEASSMTESVDKFLDGDWAATAISFTLILAQPEAGSALLKRWTNEKEKLKRAGIEGELWTAHNLTLKVERYPDILTKFFPSHSVSAFANIWMERVAFHDLVLKSFFDPREQVAKWARELMGSEQLVSRSDPCSTNESCFVDDPDSTALACEERNEAYVTTPAIDGIYREINQFGNSWHFKGPWFHLSAILPDKRFTHATAAITFNRPDMQGVVLTVDHAWLLSRFLFKVGAPIHSRAREIVVGEHPKERGLLMLDLPHCRLSLQEAGVREFFGVADRLTLAMRDALLALERAWSAHYFPFLSYEGTRVALAGISRSLWRAIGEFVLAHDEAKGNTSWHMFDGNLHALKPFHSSATEHFDAGHHGIFYANEIEGLSYTDEVVLMWQPNGIDPGQDCSPRGWWSCEYAWTWLRSALLPEVKRWAYKQMYGTAWSRVFRWADAKAYALQLEEQFVIRDLRELPLLIEGKYTQSLIDSVQELQSFFTAPSAGGHYIPPGNVEGLYEAVALAAKAGRGYVGYARSKLGIREHSVNHGDFIAHIRQYVSDGHVCNSSDTADGALRALLEMLCESETHLPDVDRQVILDSLIPFIRIRDEASFVQRHTKWRKVGG